MRDPGPAPLVRWRPPLRRERRVRTRRWLAATAAGLAVVALATGVDLADPTPRLVWNASASAPVGLWRVRPGAPVVVGD